MKEQSIASVPNGEIFHGSELSSQFYFGKNVRAKRENKHLFFSEYQRFCLFLVIDEHR